MMLQDIEEYFNKPKLYEPSTAKFWDDDHISKGMLEAHLNPSLESATRTLKFVKRSAAWIAKIAPAQQYSRLLDMGCGPGIYAELFDDAGFQVTGIDVSKRSISYAAQTAKSKGKHIAYSVCDYLSMDYKEQFDIATLIYCDFGVLSTSDRALLLKKIHSALRKGGLFIFDVFTPEQYKGKSESKHWAYERSGFWSAVPYLCFSALYHYDEDKTYLQQYLIITEDDINCYNIWEHTFTKEELELDLENAGFKIVGIYSNVAGGEYFSKTPQLCVVAEAI